MDALLGQLAEVGGLPALMLGFMILAVGYLYKRVEALQKENVDTLKLVLPLMEKFQQTVDTTLRVISKKGGEE
jgi:hypothetical protein